MPSALRYSLGILDSVLMIGNVQPVVPLQDHAPLQVFGQSSQRALRIHTTAFRGLRTYNLPISLYLVVVEGGVIAGNVYIL